MVGTERNGAELLTVVSRSSLPRSFGASLFRRPVAGNKARLILSPRKSNVPAMGNWPLTRKHLVPRSVFTSTCYVMAQADNTRNFLSKYRLNENLLIL